MPLIKSMSKKAMGKNIATEMNAGKPQKQSIAIAYNIAKKSGKKKMAYGGKAEATNESSVPSRKSDDQRPPQDAYMSKDFTDGPTPKRKPDDMRPDKEEYMGGSSGGKYAMGGYAEGGYTSGSEAYDDNADKNSLHYKYDRMSEKDAENLQKKGPEKFNENEQPENLAYGGAAEDTNEPPMPKKKDDNYREPEDEYMGKDWSYGSAPARKPDDERLPEDEYMADHFAEGGEAEGHYPSVADAIMSKKKRIKMMADGGMADVSENADESFNNEDQMSFNALRKENYSETPGLEALDQPEDSNEHGRTLSDADEHDGARSMSKSFAERLGNDVVDAIRRKMKSQRR